MTWLERENNNTYSTIVLLPEEAVIAHSTNVHNPDYTQCETNNMYNGFAYLLIGLDKVRYLTPMG